MSFMTKTLILFLAAPFLISCVSGEPESKITPPEIKMRDREIAAEKYGGTLEELDSEALYSFYIMSDNKGDSINREEFKRMVDWTTESNMKFVIGLGDHVDEGAENSFLEYMVENEWWKNNFYPNVADGENGYFGESQADWGAGFTLLKLLEMEKKTNTIIRDNKAEYYSRIEVGENHTVHLIQLHYSDTPVGHTLAFKQDSRDYMIKTLNSIDKKEGDIIIIGAHSESGLWVDVLSEEERNIVMGKADLLLSATTHVFKVFDIEGYYKERLEDELRVVNRTGALCLNTGAITNARGKAFNGYVEVHMLEAPDRLVIQYINAEKGQRELSEPGSVIVKEINGEIYYPGFK